MNNFYGVIDAIERTVYILLIIESISFVVAIKSVTEAKCSGNNPKSD